MKTTIVPAQVMTLEDRIAGNLGVSQLLLLVAPLFGGSMLFVVLPPLASYAPYKVILTVVLVSICGVLAIRLNGKIVLVWASVILRYCSRPSYYVFTKKSLNNRAIPLTLLAHRIAPATAPQPTSSRARRRSSARATVTSGFIARPPATLYFTTTKKGGFRVHVRQTAH